MSNPAYDALRPASLTGLGTRPEDSATWAAAVMNSDGSMTPYGQALWNNYLTTSPSAWIATNPTPSVGALTGLAYREANMPQPMTAAQQQQRLQQIGSMGGSVGPQRFAQAPAIRQLTRVGTVPTAWQTNTGQAGQQRPTATWGPSATPSPGLAQLHQVNASPFAPQRRFTETAGVPAAPNRSRT